MILINTKNRFYSFKNFSKYDYLNKFKEHNSKHCCNNFLVRQDKRKTQYNTFLNDYNFKFSYTVPHFFAFRDDLYKNKSISFYYHHNKLFSFKKEDIKKMEKIVELLKNFSK